MLKLIFLAIAFLVIMAIFIFNRLVKYRFLLREAASGIDVQLKRRHDLIPNIVESVKGYMQYEQNVLKEIVELRSKVMYARDITEKNALESDLSQGIKKIFALAENYPDLKASRSFLDLQKNLVEIEDQIQLSRRYYNGTVRNYNISVESFPSNIIALFFQFTPAAFFEIEYATDRQVPDVKFAS